MRLLRAAPVVAFILLFLANTGVAWAHARVVRSDPAPDVVLPSTPARVHLWFSEDLNGSASRIVVWDRYRHVMNRGSAQLVPGQPRQMVVGLKPLRPGSYLVLWTSVSAQDGHVMRGSYLFSVKERGPGPSLTGVSSGSGQTFPDAVGLIALLAHWIEMLGAVTWVGAAAFSALILAPFAAQLTSDVLEAEYSRTRFLVLLSLTSLIVSSVAVLLTEAYGLAGNDWSGMLSLSTAQALFGSEYGHLWIVRQILALIALGGAIRFGRHTRGKHLRSTVVAALVGLGAGYLYALAASGHVAATDIGALPGRYGHLFSVAVAADFGHLVADALWFGGQIYIVVVLIPALRLHHEPTHTGVFLRSLDRFSPVAYTSVATYAVSGLFAAKVQIPSWYAFFYSTYGRALIIKMALIGLMMLTSAFTVYLVRPQLRHTIVMAEGAVTRLSAHLMFRLLSWLRVNPVLGAGVLLMTSVMFYYPIPPGFAPAGAAGYVMRAAGLTATMRVTPDRSGPNQITVLLRDNQGRPVQQASVSLLTTMLDMPMGTGVVPLHAAGPGSFTGTADLGMGGHWRLQALVYQPSGLTRMTVTILVGT